MVYYSRRCDIVQHDVVMHIICDILAMLHRCLCCTSHIVLHSVARCLLCHTGVCEKTFLRRRKPLESLWKEQLLEHQIRGRMGVAAAGTQGKGLNRRSVFSQTPASYTSGDLLCQRIRDKPFSSSLRGVGGLVVGLGYPGQGLETGRHRITAT